jgi:hypothetical protein
MTHRTKITLAVSAIALIVGAYLYFSRPFLKVRCSPGVKLTVTTDASEWTHYRCGP